MKMHSYSHSPLAALATMVLACLACAAPTPAVAQSDANYPNKPIRFVVPSSPGSSPDILSRLIGGALAEELGQTVVTDLMPGAAGIVGTSRVARAEPDGYTLLYAFNQVVTMNPPLYKEKLAYDPPRDFAPISLTLNLSYMWIANPDFAPNTMAELIARNAQAPGSVKYASTGYGSAAHLGGVLLELMTGTSMLHVPYRGNTTADLLAGVVQLKLDPVAASIGLVKAGRVKVLAVSALQRLAVLPDVPTVAETLPGYSIVGWQGVWAPAGTPQAIIQILNTAIVKVIARPDIAQRIRELGYEPLSSSPRQMAERIRKETAEWTETIRRAGITLD